MATKGKSVKLTSSHDRLSLVCKYTTGGSVRFTVGRSGDSLTWGGSSDAAVARREMEAFMRFAELQTGESQGQRMERLRAVAESCDSIAELVKAVS